MKQPATYNLWSKCSKRFKGFWGSGALKVISGEQRETPARRLQSVWNLARVGLLRTLYISGCHVSKPGCRVRCLNVLGVPVCWFSVVFGESQGWDWSRNTRYRCTALIPQREEWKEFCACVRVRIRVCACVRAHAWGLTFPQLFRPWDQWACCVNNNDYRDGGGSCSPYKLTQLPRMHSSPGFVKYYRLYGNNLPRDLYR